MAQYTEAPAGTIDVLKAKMFAYFGVDCLKDMLSHFYPTINKPFFSKFALSVVEGALTCTSKIVQKQQCIAMH